MHGTIPPSIMAWKCLVFAAPFLAIAALWWLINQTDRIIHYLLPDLEWEHSLGWLNIKAERRANTALRWIGYGIYALLAAALPGIVWAAEALPQPGNWLDPWVIGDVMLRVAVLATCLGAWVLYLGGYLIPRLRTEREVAEWKRFRAQVDAVQTERGEVKSRSRFHVPLPKPRTNAPSEKLVPERTRGRRLPGG